jgi:hypothetical protein
LLPNVAKLKVGFELLLLKPSLLKFQLWLLAPGVFETNSIGLFIQGNPLTPIRHCAPVLKHKKKNGINISLRMFKNKSINE